MFGKSRITGTASNTAKTPAEKTSRVRINGRDTTRETPSAKPASRIRFNPRSK
ncbi:hypothetical protein ACFVRD_33055 [Streptomyces sp. NPDC057908]|uniref:hypothetical protein n=1 Tax=Streptomyces sp. NPDC057908 TaxID=3346276 RepID=UPI0036EDC534